MIIENETPCTTETIRLAPVVQRQSSAIVGLGLLTCGCVLLAEPYLASSLWGLLTTLPLYRTIQYYWLWRGWIALMLLCVSFAYMSVYYSNRKCI